MKSLAYWAAAHRHRAVGLIVVLQVLGMTLGSITGQYLLPPLAQAHLEGLAALLVAAAVLIYMHHDSRLLTVLHPYRFRQAHAAALLAVTLGLSLLLGQQQQHRPIGAVFSAAQASVQGDSTRFSPRRILNFRKKAAEPLPRKEKWKRVLVIVLMLLELPILGVAMVLACNLTCSGRSTEAILVILAAMGVYVGIIYLIFRIMKLPTAFWKRRNDLLTEKQRRDKRFLDWAFLGVLLFWVAFYGFGRLFSPQ